MLNYLLNTADLTADSKVADEKSSTPIVLGWEVEIVFWAISDFLTLPIMVASFCNAGFPVLVT